MKTKIAFGIVVVLAGTGFSFFSSSSLPQAQTPHATGTLIHKNQQIFTGYNSPEATLESFMWAMVNGNYDAAVASVPTNQAIKEFGRNPKQFKSESQEEFRDFKSLQILARKNVSANKVELKFETLDEGGDSTADDASIGTFLKIGGEWKLDFKASRDYTTNWEGADVVTFVERTNSPATRSSAAREVRLPSGILISAKQLTNAGYSTPEATVEAETWATVNKKDDELNKAYSPEMQEKLKGRPARGEFIVESGHSKFDSKKVKITFVELMIPAKKVISNDKVELKTAKINRQSSPGGEFMGGAFKIQQLVKIGDEWKINGERFYDKNWDAGSQPEPTIHR